MVRHLVNVHDRSVCAGHPCCVHNPTQHHMYGWRQHWRSDRAFMERLCSHGIGHPDPDQLSYLRRVHGDTDDVVALEVHACDGCCRAPTDDVVGPDDGDVVG